MVILIMGVSGSGKTTIGHALALRLRWEFADADDLHSPANKEKMSHGFALSDEDRRPWLLAVRKRMVEWTQSNRSGVMACSALKAAYREVLLGSGSRSDSQQIRIVYLQGSFELISARLQARTKHFAHENLLLSQFSTLEEPADATVIQVDQTPEQIVSEIIAKLNLKYD